MYKKLDYFSGSGVCEAYRLIEKDLITLFEYVEPIPENMKTCSHRLYEIFFRASTEFENISRKILEVNEYQKKRLTIKDFFVLGKEFELFNYSVRTPLIKGLSAPFGTEKGISIKPFEGWGALTYEDYLKSSCEVQNINWYKSYNKVKHDREQNFAEANLENALYAVSAVAILLVSQFTIHAFNVFHDITSFEFSEVSGDLSLPQSIWIIKVPDRVKWQIRMTDKT